MATPFPFLVEWKRAGLNKFPDVPFKPIVEHFIQKIVDPVPPKPDQCFRFLDDDFEDRLMQHLWAAKREKMGAYAGVSLRRSPDFDYERWAESARPAIQDFILKATQCALEQDWRLWGMRVHEARKQVVNGADREQTLRELGRLVLPSKRGGASLLTSIQLRSLKSVYLELQAAIKEVRRQSFLNQRRPDPDEVRHAAGQCFEFCPWAKAVFTAGEIKIIYSQKSPTDAAAAIIIQRLHERTNITSHHSLKNKLKGIRPLLR
jgi:hypothetical protein